MHRREAEAAEQRRQQFQHLMQQKSGGLDGDEASAAVRQREIDDDGNDGPSYLEYEALAARTIAASESSAQRSGNGGGGSGGGSDRGATCCGGGHDAKAPMDLEMHRVDGTPLDFSSREAKGEAKRQQAIERAYAEQQALWGLAPTVSAHASCSSTQSGIAVDGGERQPAAGGSSTQPRLRSLGRGRDAVRPAWLTRMESGGMSN